MQLPVELVNFDKWYAFKGPLPTQDKEHRIIIVYKSSETINYFYVTSYESEKEKRKIDMINRNDKSSIAELNKEDWTTTLTKNSCVQCNLAHMCETTFDNLKNWYVSGKVEYLGMVPDIVKSKIIAATCYSVTFNNEEKRHYTE